MGALFGCFAIRALMSEPMFNPFIFQFVPRHHQLVLRDQPMEVYPFVHAYKRLYVFALRAAQEIGIIIGVVPAALKGGLVLDENLRSIICTI